MSRFRVALVGAALGLGIALLSSCRSGDEPRASASLEQPGRGQQAPSASPAHVGAPSPVRREAVAPRAGSAALGATSAPRRRSAGRADAPGRREVVEAQLLYWEFEQAPFGPTPVLVHVPPHARGQRLPVLVAYHGRGEAVKPPPQGVRGWWQDYALERALARLAEPPLVREDFHGWIEPKRLHAINRRLAEDPYAGLIVVMPFLHDVLKGDAWSRQGPRLAQFVDEQLVRAVQRRLETVQLGQWGIDGVSLGGRAALWIGLSLPEQFAVVGATQGALDPAEIETVVRLVRSARARRPDLRLRLVTSDRDYYREVIESLRARLVRAAAPVDFALLRGKHGYRFNRGPGALEMLLYYDRQLRR